MPFTILLFIIVFIFRFLFYFFTFLLLQQSYTLMFVPALLPEVDVGLVAHVQFVAAIADVVGTICCFTVSCAVSAEDDLART